MSNRIDNLLFSKGFDWGLHPQIEGFLNEQISLFLEHHSYARNLSNRMETETATRFFDWIDHFILPEKKVSPNRLIQLGFQEVAESELPTGTRMYYPPGTTFFPVLLSYTALIEIVLKPEHLDHFIQMTGKNIPIDGAILAPYRKAVISSQNEYVLSAVERRGYNGFVVPNDVKDVIAYQNAIEAFFGRPRHFDTEIEGLNAILNIITGFLKSLSPERVTDAFFRAERLYWERQNWAGQVQRARQDRLGLGWGNHDHHTYRSSRESFIHLIKIFETLGFLLREQFFAGEQAGWGAQLLEHPGCNITIFSDVDISIDERAHDFAHLKMESRDELKTVGLWVALHGESMLEAGMHHLASRVDFELARSNLKTFGIEFMNPFSSFDFLKQAFTAIERRKVAKSRLEGLFRKKLITQDQYNSFLTAGAISSHFEPIQRNQGFKGFNQDSVTAIIHSTDPRAAKIKGA